MRALVLTAASAALLGVLWAGPVSAQAPGLDTPPPALPPPGYPPLGGPGWIPPGGGPPAGSPAVQDRYELQQTEGGFLRLDRVSGLTEFCASTPDGYACKAVAEGKSADAAMLARLEKRVAELEKQVRALSSSPQSLLPPSEAAPPLAGKDPTAELPTDDQLDRLANFLERALKRLKGIAEDVQKDEKSEGKL
ncbi:MAG: hypothetical protein ABW275_01165 [Hansschlegelia sp.]